MPDEKEQRDFTPPHPSGTPPPHQVPQQQFPPDQLPLVDELGIEDVNDPLAGGRGRLFSAAGRFSPLIEFTDEHVIMHPPQLPFSEDGPSEDIVTKVDSRGVLLDEIGNAKHIAGARFNGQVLWYLGEQLPGTTKYLVAWFDQQGRPHKLYVNDEPLTVDVVFRLRNKTHDGELSFFADVTTD